MKKLKENKKLIVPIGIIALVLIVGLTYAWLIWRGNGNQTVRIKGGTLSLILDETSRNGIDIDNAIPMSDAQGLDSNYTENLYTFSVVNNGNMNASYELYLDDVELGNGETRISDNYIKYSITRSGSRENPQILSSTTNRKIDGAIINKNTTYQYTLRLWIDSETTTSVADQVFKAKLRLVGTQTEDSADSTYSVSGQLVDTENNPVSNANIAFFSNPIYTTTDSEGNFNVTGLDYGTHTIYYAPSGVSIEGLSKNEIESIDGCSSVLMSINKTSGELTLANGYKIKNTKISSGKVDASMVSYDDTYNMGCTDVACALDKLHEEL